jgi:hypothetical protein
MGIIRSVENIFKIANTMEQNDNKKKMFPLSFIQRKKENDRSTVIRGCDMRLLVGTALGP